MAHSDAGTLILPSYNQRKTQILHPAVDHWVNIKPVTGYTVINMGGSLRQIFGQKLKSYLPRILPYTSCEAGDPFSIITSNRLKEDVIFVDETGKEWRQINWHIRKFDAVRNRDAE